ncbi:Putative lipoprotein (fragment) [Staphylococcus capitis]
MKKFFAVLLSSFLVLSACSHSDYSDKKDSDKNSSKTESKKVG